MSDEGEEGKKKFKLQRNEGKRRSDRKKNS